MSGLLARGVSTGKQALQNPVIQQQLRESAKKAATSLTQSINGARIGNTGISSQAAGLHTSASSLAKKTPPSTPGIIIRSGIRPSEITRIETPWRPLKSGELKALFGEKRIGVIQPADGYAELALRKEVAPLGLTNNIIPITHRPPADGRPHILLKAATATRAYTDVDQITDAVLRYNADNPGREVVLLHPLYGFLSESYDANTAFAQAGFPYIGPDPASMRLGDKDTIKEARLKAGLGVNPGITLNGPIDSQVAQVQRFMADHGGVILKPRSGGGGGGMVIITKNDPAIIRKSIEQSTAGANATGESVILCESFHPYMRHIEVQILGASKLNLSDPELLSKITPNPNPSPSKPFSSRECTPQMAHGKLVETTLPPELEPYRAEIEEDAKILAQHTQYGGPGTTEFGFIVDPKTGAPTKIKLVLADGSTMESYVFPIEKNTRFQVERFATNDEIMVEFEGRLYPLNLLEEYFKATLMGMELPSDEQLKRMYDVIHMRVMAQDVNPQGQSEILRVDTSGLPPESYAVMATGPISPDVNPQVGRLVTRVRKDPNNPQASWDKAQALAAQAWDQLTEGTKGTMISFQPAGRRALSHPDFPQRWTTERIDTVDKDLTRANLATESDLMHAQRQLQFAASAIVNGGVKFSRFQDESKRPGPAHFDAVDAAIVDWSARSVTNNSATIIAKGGLEAYAALLRETGGGLEDANNRDKTQGPTSSVPGREAYQLQAEVILRHPSHFMMESRLGGATKQVELQLNDRDYRKTVTEAYPTQVAGTELARGFAVQSVTDQKIPQLRREYWQGHYDDLVAAGYQTDPKGRIVNINKTFVAGNSALEIATASMEAAEAGHIISPAFGWDSMTKPGETDKIAEATYVFLAARQAAKDLFMESEKVPNKETVIARVKERATLSEDRIAEILSDSAFEQMLQGIEDPANHKFSTIPETFYHKNPGANQAWTADRIQVEVNGIITAYQSVFGQKPLFGFSHTHLNRDKTQTAEATALLRSQREAHPDCPLVLTVAGSHPGTHPGLVEVARDAFGVDLTEADQAMNLAMRTFDAYDTGYRTKSDSDHPGGAEGPSLDALATRTVISKKLDLIHDIGQQVQSGRIAVTPRSKENVDRGLELWAKYKDDVVTAFGEIYDLDNLNKEQRVKIAEFVQDCVLADMQSGRFDITFPQEALKLWSVWAEKSAYDTPKAKAFREFVLERQPYTPDESAVAQLASPEERLEALKNKTRRADVTHRDVALQTAFPRSQWLAREQQGSSVYFPDRFTHGTPPKAGDSFTFYDRNGQKIPAKLISVSEPNAAGFNTVKFELQLGGSTIHETVKVANQAVQAQQQQALLAKIPDYNKDNPLQAAFPTPGVITQYLPLDKSEDGIIVITPQMAKDGYHWATTEAMKMSMQHRITLPEGRYRVKQRPFKVGDTLNDSCIPGDKGPGKVGIEFERVD